MVSGKAAVVVIAAVAAISSCSSHGQNSGWRVGRGDQAAVRYRDLPISALGGATGILHGDRRSGCIWLSNRISAHQITSEQIVLVGPFRVSWQPLVVHERGQSNRYAGQRAEFQGGLIRDKGVSGCPIRPRTAHEIFGAG